LERLGDEYYAPWERIMDKYNGLLLAGRLREAVLKVSSLAKSAHNQLPILSTFYLEGIAEQRRAYVVLSFLAHGYIWGDPTSTDVTSPLREI
jgi:indoleamine 2,3-dioxygenase